MEGEACGTEDGGCGERKKERRKERFVGWLGGIVSKANQGQQDKLECAKTEMNVRAVEKIKYLPPSIR